MLLLFFLAWIIFNGRITAEIVIFGLVISGLMFSFICKFMDYSPQKEKILIKKSLAFCGYIFLLIKEIIKANLTVCHMILTRNEIMEPVIVKVPTNLKSDIGRVILANSITLTPGTITVSVNEKELIVHCLDKSLAEGMEDSMFVKLLEEMEGGRE